MNIRKKCVYGYYDYLERSSKDGWWWGNMVSYGLYALDSLEEVKKDLRAIEILIDSNFNDLSDKDFYYLISRFYLVDLTVSDLLNVLSRVNSVYYDKLELLNSRRIFGIGKSEGRGKDYDCWTEKYQTNFVVATAKNFSLRPDYNYSKEEIEKMNLKQFAAISECAEYVGRDKAKVPYHEEEYDEINIPYLECDSKYFGQIADQLTDPDPFLNIYDLRVCFNCLKEEESDFNKKVYKEAVSMIRMRLNKNQVLNDFKKIILFLNVELERLVIRIKEEPFYVYDFQEEKYLNLSNELIDINKKLLLKLENKRIEEEACKVLKRSIY